MIKKRNEQTKTSEYNSEGKKAFDLYDLSEFEGIKGKIKQFSYVELDEGEEVPFHVHEGEFESYYIISGKGLYLDHDKEVEVLPGTVTFTPSGKGHGLKNTGEEELVFIALIVAD